MATTGSRGKCGRPRKNLEGLNAPDKTGTKLPSCEGSTVALVWLSPDCKQYFDMLKSKLREKGIDRNEFSIALNRWANTLGDYIKVKDEAAKTPYIIEGSASQTKVHPIHVLLSRKALELDNCCRMFGFTPDTLNKLVIPKTHFEVGESDFGGF